MSDKQEGTTLALLLNLSDIYQNQAQFNTVVVQQEKVDRVGFEPTTSAAALFQDCSFYLLFNSGKDNIIILTP